MDPWLGDQARRGAAGGHRAILASRRHTTRGHQEVTMSQDEQQPEKRVSTEPGQPQRKAPKPAKPRKQEKRQKGRKG
jgi:hypothetical protein